MAETGHDNDGELYCADVGTHLIIATGEDWLGDDEILVAAEDYESIDDWR